MANDERQRFYVEMTNDATGEKWGVVVAAVDPPEALTKVLRRRRWAEALLSEHPHRFIVSDEPLGD